MPVDSAVNLPSPPASLSSPSPSPSSPPERSADVSPQSLTSFQALSIEATATHTPPAHRASPSPLPSPSPPPLGCGMETTAQPHPGLIARDRAHETKQAPTTRMKEARHHGDETAGHTSRTGQIWRTDHVFHPPQSAKEAADMGGGAAAGRREAGADDDGDAAGSSSSSSSEPADMEEEQGEEEGDSQSEPSLLSSPDGLCVLAVAAVVVSCRRSCRPLWLVQRSEARACGDPDIGVFSVRAARSEAAATPPPLRLLRLLLPPASASDRQRQHDRLQQQQQQQQWQHSQRGRQRHGRCLLSHLLPCLGAVTRAGAVAVPAAVASCPVWWAGCCLFSSRSTFRLLCSSSPSAAVEHPRRACGEAAPGRAHQAARPHLLRPFGSQVAASGRRRRQPAAAHHLSAGSERRQRRQQQRQRQRQRQQRQQQWLELRRQPRVQLALRHGQLLLRVH